MGNPRFATTKDLLSSFPAAAAYLRDAGSPEVSLHYVERRVAEKRLDLAISYCAFLLPRREAVWWGCQCIADVDSLNDCERRMRRRRARLGFAARRNQASSRFEKRARLEQHAFGDLDGAGGGPVGRKCRSGRSGAGRRRSGGNCAGGAGRASVGRDPRGA